MDEDGALFDSGFDGAKPFRDTPESGGISLEAALRDFGPAALDDLIPRVRRLAVILDRAHSAGAVHGALHPSKVFITDDSTSLIRGTSSSAPYLAPEVVDGEAPTAAADQFSLAAITYEWLFGRPIDRPAGRPVEVRSMPGADRAALSKAFTRALSPKPGDRFDSCSEFCDRLADSVVLELPLALEADPETVEDADVDPADTLVIEETRPLRDWPTPEEARIVAEEAHMTAASDSTREQPDFDAIDRDVAVEKPSAESTMAFWPQTGQQDNGPAGQQANNSARFGGGALFVALIVGAIFGFAAGYMARPRALQTGPPQTFATPPGTEGSVAPKTDTPQTAPAPAPQARQAPKAPEAPTASGRILVRSNPAGASVSVDGVAKGVTPLALRDLEFGTRSIGLTRRGYIAETRTVAITRERPSRTLDVRLTVEASASATKGRSGATAPQRSAPPAPKAAAATGALVIDSRPIGASVSVNGTARGVTPLTINDLAPGDYRIVMTLQGFRNFATTVRVVAGERVRAAASLTAQEQE